MRTISLNFDWKFTEQWDDKYISPSASEKGFEKVDIPHTVKETPYNNFDEGMYQFVSCYRKHFRAESDWQGKRLILEFGAVANMAEVYVNGEYVTAHKGGYTAFTADITDKINYGEDNVITVKVDSTERPDIPPFGGVVDYLCYGGIYREVYLQIREPVYIKRMLLTPKVPEWGARELKVDVTLSGPAEGASFDLEVVGMDGVVVATAHKEGDFTCEEGKVPMLTVNFSLPNARLWDTEDPYLYTVIAKLGEDEVTERCGIRDCRFRADAFYLNHRPLKIRGLNRHQSYPYVGYAMPKSVQEDEAVFLKQTLGVNLVRTSHYPDSRHFLDKCDELGLLVFTEIPGWQHVSKDEEWRNLCLQHVKEMIYEDYNHPSVILWGVRINESGDDDDLYKRTNALAKALDKSRNTGGVRCIPRSHLLEDVYTYNDFIHSGQRRALLPKFVVCKSGAPLLITEHNGHMFPTKTFDHEKKRQEHALRHARVLNAMYKSSDHVGVIGWCMSDYNTHKDFGSGDKICYHGVSDMFRIPKLAAYVYMSQQTEIPVLELSSNMEIGDVAGGKVGDVYIFTNCDEIKMYKNGQLINVMDMNKLRARSPFKYMPMPPVLLEDVIGNQLENTEYNFTKRDAESIKKALLSVKKYGVGRGIARHFFTLLKAIIKYRLSIESITMLFGKYVTGWGGKQVSYTFEGYKDGEKVITVNKGSVCSKDIVVKADREVLEEGDTYAATRVEMKMVSQLGNTLVYDNSVVTLKAEGCIEIIGPHKFALIGGQRAAWVRTKGVGNGKLTISSDGLPDKVVEFNVVKEEKPVLNKIYPKPVSAKEGEATDGADDTDKNQDLQAEEAKAEN